MKTVFSSQRRETLSFLITTVATVTSRVNQQYTYYSGAPRAARSARVGGAPYLRKCGNLPIRQNLVITRLYTEPATVRPHHRHTNVNRYNNPNSRFYLEGNHMAALTFRKKKQQQSRRYVYTTVDNRERARAIY